VIKRGQEELYKILEELGVNYKYHEHPPIPTIEEAKIHWEDLDATHCKNIFFRDHKGKKHYLVILEHTQKLAIRDLEQRLKRGKLTFASEKRLEKYLKLTPGSVSPFGLINDKENHVHLFIDENLKQAKTISFHPNINTASLVVDFNDFKRYLDYTGNTYEFIKLYD
jgi:Ala-tRNA(Pro) deacylase